MRAREGAQVALVPIDRLRAHPRNVRHDLGDLRELADSIANEGVLVPVMAERRGDVLRLLHGHRRVEAARQAGVRRVPCVVVAPHADDQAIALMVAENTQRRTLSAAEKRDEVDALHGHGWTLEQIASRLGVAVSTVSSWRRAERAEDEVDDAEPEPTARAVVDEHAVEALIAGRKCAAGVSIGERREAVARLTAQGWSLEAIADRIGADERQVSRDRAIKGQANRSVNARNRRPSSISARKVAAVVADWEDRAPRELLDQLRALLAGTIADEGEAA